MTDKPEINVQISDLEGLGTILSIPSPEEFFVITEKNSGKETNTFHSQCFTVSKDNNKLSTILVAFTLGK